MILDSDQLLSEEEKHTKKKTYCVEQEEKLLILSFPDPFLFKLLSSGIGCLLSFRLRRLSLMFSLLA